MTTASKVRELDFSDLYLGHPSLGDWFSDVAGAQSNPLRAGEALRADLNLLTAACRRELQATPSAADFAVRHDGASYRVSVLRASAGATFALRKIAAHVPPLAELGIPRTVIASLMTRDLSGLLIVSGGVKAGKTTTACALAKDRLAAYGGVTVTGEMPIELPLEGNHGQGICFQTAMPRDPREFSDAFRTLIRSGARTVLIDEIRDRDTAAAVLEASTSGQLIVTTMLADSALQTVVKLHALANHKLSGGSAQSLIADGLVGVLYQKMVRGSLSAVATEFLFMKDAPTLKTVLRNGEYRLLASDVRQQLVREA
jgi:Tfp pilus assembly pilus retraction ATPase PilT